MEALRIYSHKYSQDSDWENPAAISVHKGSPSLPGGLCYHGDHVVSRWGAFNPKTITILLKDCCPNVTIAIAVKVSSYSLYRRGRG